MFTGIRIEDTSRSEWQRPLYAHLLPHEVIWLGREVAALENKLQVIGDTLGMAMDEGAETNHDNAPAEAMVSESRTLVDGGNNNELYKIFTRHRFDIIKYPVLVDCLVRPGSLVEVQFADETEPEQYEIGGNLLLGPNGPTGSDFERLTPPDVTLITFWSALGNAMLGSKAGSVITYPVEIRGKVTNYSAEILSVDQTAQDRYSQILSHIVPEDFRSKSFARKYLASVLLGAPNQEATPRQDEAQQTQVAS